MLTPHACNSSWAFSVAQMIADRESKATSGKHQVRISAQALINCGVGKCSKGGNPMDALLYLEKYGIPDESCQNYQGVDPAKESCTGVGFCGYCSGSVFDFKCSEFKSYKRWKIKTSAFFSGAHNMANELADGPIVCGMHVSEEFKRYKGGIFRETSLLPKIDHYVEIVGQGSDGQQQYWIGRNFWGTAWGEGSFFRIQKDKDNLGI
jgi:hypothetical protein